MAAKSSDLRNHNNEFNAEFGNIQLGMEITDGNDTLWYTFIWIFFCDFIIHHSKLNDLGEIIISYLKNDPNIAPKGNASKMSIKSRRNTVRLQIQFSSFISDFFLQEFLSHFLQLYSNYWSSWWIVQVQTHGSF